VAILSWYLSIVASLLIKERNRFSDFKSSNTLFFLLFFNIQTTSYKGMLLDIGLVLPDGGFADRYLALNWN